MNYIHQLEMRCLRIFLAGCVVAFLLWLVMVKCVAALPVIPPIVTIGCVNWQVNPPGSSNKVFVEVNYPDPSTGTNHEWVILGESKVCFVGTRSWSGGTNNQLEWATKVDGPWRGDVPPPPVATLFFRAVNKP